MIANANKASRLFTLILPLASLLRLCLVFLILVGVAQAQSLNNSESQSDKISPLLKRNMRADETVTVVVTLNGPTSGGLNGFMNRNGVRLRREMKALHSFSVSLPSRLIPELASFPEVDHVSANATVVGFGHAATTTGAAAGQAAATAAGRGTINGAGVGIAILDSGIDVNHAQFSPGSSRILASVDFTGENRTDDPFGHGTFVAAAAAGGAGAGSEYTGMAPGASLVNVRVLDSDGQGTVETVLAGLDWVATHARTHNIRVVNLSIGTRAVESYKYDALCRAVRGLVNSGILVVVAAGNEGKDEEGEKIYGSIHSPGIEPSAFTIGASNTFQTNGRSDDGVATYSSRGPTRGHWTDGDNVVHHDNVLKPDMVAPGNKLVFAQSPNNVLIAQNPTLNESSSGTSATMKVMRMSGTSVSTPIAAGAAALLFQLNPKLTPNMARAFMEYTAQVLSGEGVLDQGAGQLNIEGAMRLVMAVRTDLASPVHVGLSLLTTSVTASSSFSSSSFNWSTTVVRKFNTVSGSGLISRFHGPYALSLIHI